MRKITRRQTYEEVGPVTLHLDDYFALVEVFAKEGVSIKVTIDDIELDRPEEVLDLAQDFVQSVEIETTRKQCHSNVYTGVF